MSNVLAWYPHYVADWLTDGKVRPMSYGERGMFHDLIMWQWVEGHLPADLARLQAGLSKPDDPATASLARIVEECFPIDEDGHRRNPRIAGIRADKLKVAQRLKVAGRRGGLAKAGLKYNPSEASGRATQSEPEPEVKTRSENASRSQLSTDNGRSQRPTPPDPRQGWNTRFAELLKAECYRGSSPPQGITIAEDLRWIRLRLDEGKSEDAVTAAIRGLPLVMLDVKGKKWSPARVFSKRGNWINLFDRAITADGKSGRPRPIAELLRGGASGTPTSNA